MATIVNTTPATSGESGSGGMGFLLGIILLVLFAFVFFVYGLPYVTGAIRGSQAPQVQVPDKVDVNVKGLPNK